MPWYYVYSPLSGYCTSRISNQTYCSGGPHAITGGSGFKLPLDLVISSPGVQRLDFWGSSNIGSIRTTRRSNMCIVSPGTPWNDAVDVEMFTGPNASGSYIGTVRFGHIDSPIQNNIYNSLNGQYIGWTPGECTCRPCACYDCYTARHVHMEIRQSVTPPAGQGYNTGLDGCSNPWAYYSSTWVYELYLP